MQSFFAPPPLNALVSEMILNREVSYESEKKEARRSGSADCRIFREWVFAAA